MGATGPEPVLPIRGNWGIFTEGKENGKKCSLVLKIFTWKGKQTRQKVGWVTESLQSQ